MSDTTTRGIRVRVAPVYVPERSAPEEGRYLFAYRIRITNTGDETVRLERRRWVITDATGHTEEVEGPGVVGETPVLPPGTTFEYTSFCPLATSFGTMQGSYSMRNASGDTFEVQIGQFSLVAPHAVN
jgi:ApaG protein